MPHDSIIEDGKASGFYNEAGRFPLYVKLADMPSRRKTLLSPLRYPGAKRRLVGYIRTALKANDLIPKLFVEPFAGGAGVALQLLCEGSVKKIGLGEKDELIASFWETVLEDTDWLIGKVRNIEIEVEKWDEFRNASLQTRRQKALACLFLNRTSFSGILASTAGPLGGRAQKSDYKIDCRFNRETIVRRIREIAELGDKVAFVRQGKWQDTVAYTKSLNYAEQDVFFYLDPPFYKKADRLYTHYFEDQDHKDLRDGLGQLESPWLLSYDAAEKIKKLYKLNGRHSSNGHGQAELDVVYSASADALRKSQELIITNLAKLPS